MITSRLPLRTLIICLGLGLSGCSGLDSSRDEQLSLRTQTGCCLMTPTIGYDGQIYLTPDGISESAGDPG